jgi:hypothetical protein
MGDPGGEVTLFLYFNFQQELKPNRVANIPNQGGVFLKIERVRGLKWPPCGIRVAELDHPLSTEQPPSPS